MLHSEYFCFAHFLFDARRHKAIIRLAIEDFISCFRHRVLFSRMLFVSVLIFFVSFLWRKCDYACCFMFWYSFSQVNSLISPSVCPQTPRFHNSRFCYRLITLFWPWRVATTKTIWRIISPILLSTNFWFWHNNLKSQCFTKSTFWSTFVKSKMILTNIHLFRGWGLRQWSKWWPFYLW